ncbi:MAG: M20/M25/M40 family metallo-hydrolase [Actinobacteria bacterium]|nr:M20/M25/M40 family metallo-hydrolase [Actinomycetota bacterium]MCL5883376.1 M20/M25/M40 family metallo-hydrolase [Actinomycetota bacterium]
MIKRIKSNSRNQAPFFLLILSVFSMLTFAVVSLAGCGNSEQGNRVDVAPASGTLRDFKPPPKTVPAETAPTVAAAASQTQQDQLLSAYSLDSQFSYLTIVASSSYQGRRTDSAGARASAAYISSEFSRLGLQPWTGAGLSTYLEHFNASGLESDNVIGILPGSAANGSHVIIASHYDHLGLDSSGRPYNGADDNAAGVAAVLEMARVFQQTGIRPADTIVFCAFSGEEEGELGSAALGQQLVVAGISKNVEMINIDGIGATGGSYFGVWDEGADNTAPLLETLRQAGQALGVPVRAEGTDIGSDAQSFDWQYSIPAVTVDWSWGQDASAWHPYYHTIYDTPEKIDQSVMAQATKVSLLGLWLRANG